MAEKNSKFQIPIYNEFNSNGIVFAHYEHFADLTDALEEARKLGLEGYHDDAIKKYNQIVEIKDDNLHAWLEKGLEHQKIKDYKNAIFSFNKYLQYRDDKDVIEYRKIALNKLTQYMVKSSLYQWTEEGNFSKFGFPAGICTDLDDNLYVTDKNKNQILKFDDKGTFLTKWGSDGTYANKLIYMRRYNNGYNNYQT